MKIKQTAGRDKLGSFAPLFAHINDDVLFGEVWSGDEITLKERSIVTVTALMAQGLVDSSFKYHLITAKKNGITGSEIAGILTHAAFYAGWSKAWAAFSMAAEVWNDGAETDGLSGFAAKSIFPIGEKNDAFAKYFIGQSYLAPILKEQGIFNVTFEPACRNNWHIHHADKGGGQILIAVAGEGWYREWGKPPIKLRAGDAVNIPAGVKHFHGASKDSWFSHLAIEVPGKNASTEWLEPVSDEEYFAIDN